jgi:hypothetical protein
MPIKKKTTAAKKPAAKKPAVLGPKAKLMKLLVGTLRNKAKKLGISDVSKRTKENLAQSIMLAEARKKRGTAMGKKATAKRKVSATRQTKGTGATDIIADRRKQALPPGKRVSKKSGNVYYERRRDRSDKGLFLGEKYNGWTNYWTWKYNLEALSTEYWLEQIEEGQFSSIYDLSQAIKDEANELAEEASPNWAKDWVNSAFSEVNWWELADHLAEGTDLTK